MVERRSIEELQHRQNVLVALLELIRDGDQATVNRVISAIRSNNSHEEVIRALSELTGVSNGRNGSQLNGGNTHHGGGSGRSGRT